MSSLALLQLTLLGSAAPCIAQGSVASSTSEHAGHDSVTSNSSHGDAHRATDSPAPLGGNSDLDCAFRACAAPPVLLASPALQDLPRPEPTEFDSVVPDAPRSPFYPLDPPPPRT